jgi:hypothetical protein
MARLHRNNAAEWIMLIAIAPVVWTMRLIRGPHRTRASREPSGSAAGASTPSKPSRPVMIEGLPPRTMN